MTEEEKKAIEKLKNYVKSQKEESNMFGYITTLEKDLKNTETVLYLIQKQQVEIEKKDKIIHLMATWLDEDDTSFGYGNLSEVNTPEKIKQYFEKKAEEK